MHLIEGLYEADTGLSSEMAENKISMILFLWSLYFIEKTEIECGHLNSTLETTNLSPVSLVLRHHFHTSYSEHKYSIKQNALTYILCITVFW